MNLGKIDFRASQLAPSGTFISKTIMVIIMARTPSLNASNLFVVIRNRMSKTIK